MGGGRREGIFESFLRSLGGVEQTQTTAKPTSHDPKVCWDASVSKNTLTESQLKVKTQEGGGSLLSSSLHPACRDLDG